MENSPNESASESSLKTDIPLEKALSLSRFVYLLLGSQFEHAREALESERYEGASVAVGGISPPTNEALPYTSPSARSFIAVLVNPLAQLANLEALYHALAFSTPSGKTIVGVTFRAGRTEGTLKEGYRQLSKEFSKLTNPAAPDSSPPNGESIASEFHQLVQARIALIDFYQALAVRDWRSTASESTQALAEIRTVLAERKEVKEGGGLTDSIRRLYEREIEILEALCELMTSIPQFQGQGTRADFQMLDSLLSLKFLRDALHDWYLATVSGDPASRAGSPKKVTSPASQQSSSVSFFSSLLGRKSASSAARVASSQSDTNNKSVALLNLLHAFYQSQLAKFSLYFHDTLAQHSPGGEMRWAVQQQTQHGHSYLQLCHTFYIKHQPKLIVLLVNRIDEVDTFKGFGYTRDITGEIWGPSAHDEVHSCAEEEEGSSTSSSGGGILEKYPPLFAIPSMAHDRRLFDSLYPSITSFVQEGRGYASTSTPITPVGTSPPPTNSFGAAVGTGGVSGTIRYLHDRNKDQSYFAANVGEANVHLVVVFTDRRVQEKDANVMAFLQEVVGGLRGVRTPAMQQLRAAMGAGK